MKVLKTLILFVASINYCFAQTDTTKTTEEDFSQYAEMEATDSQSKTVYCTSKIIGQLPSRLISIGYDYLLPHTAAVDSFLNYEKETFTIKNNQVYRFLANFPVISNTKWLINLGANLMQSKYTSNNSNNALTNTFKNGLITIGINATVFKPFNSKHFTLVQANFDINGDYTLSKFQNLNTVRTSIAALYGIKKHDRLQIGFGLSRTFRAGEAAYFPILMYNYTSVNKKWGFECLLPARGAFRYNLNARNFLSTGFELEGNSYQIQSLSNAVLRRSELRLKLNYDFSIHNFFWIGLQTGLRYNYKFNLDSKYFNRTIGKSTPYAMNNSLTNPLFFAISLNLVSP
jgi:hypothetical protein